MSKQKHQKNRSRIKKIIKWSFAACMITSFCVSYLVYRYYSADLPNLEGIIKYEPTLVNEIYSSDGRLVGRFGYRKRNLVDLDSIPEYVVGAFIAVEDKRFFDHVGLDLKGVLRAIVQNIREGKVVEGGSTITQQITKNLILTPERTFSRKFKEAILSYRIEKNLSKDEILYLYLNHIYLAEGIYGVEAASNRYFGKSVRDINVAEAALLAAIPRRPKKYSPRKYLDNALNRQKLVLNIMRKEEIIDDRQFKEAVEYPISIISESDFNYQVAPYFVEYAREYLENKVGTEQYRFGGYKVMTTMDVDLSLSAHWAVKRGIYNYESRWDNNFIKEKLDSRDSIELYLHGQNEAGTDYKDGTTTDAVVTEVREVRGHIKSATVSFSHYNGEIKYVVYNKENSLFPEEGIGFHFSKKYLPVNSYKDIYIIPEEFSIGDIISVKINSITDENIAKVELKFQNNAQSALISIDKNGNVVAMVGGVEFKDSQFNRSTFSLRQPGSSFKPLIYSAALDKGYTQTSLLFDAPVSIDEWEPKNYDDEYMGAITLRESLIDSRNLSSVRLILDIGTEYAADYCRRFKFSSKLNPYPSLVLGGSSVTLLEMVQAYSIFANGGLWVKPRFILRIYDRNDQIIEDNTGEYFIDKEKILKKERVAQRNELLKKLAEQKGRVVPQSVNEYETIQEGDYIALNDEDIDEKSGFLTSNEFIEILKQNRSLILETTNNPERIIAEDISYLVTDLLQAVVKEGTGIRANFLNNKSPIAGKTGTSNDFKDAWFIGYSPDLVTGVWVGKDNNLSLGEKEPGSKTALPIWIDYMDYALDLYKADSFRVPGGIEFSETQYGRIAYSIKTLREKTLRDIKSKLGNMDQ